MKKLGTEGVYHSSGVTCLFGICAPGDIYGRSSQDNRYKISLVKEPSSREPHESEEEKLY